MLAVLTEISLHLWNANQHPGMRTSAEGRHSTFVRLAAVRSCRAGQSTFH